METVKIVNLDQVSKYIQHDIKPVDIQYTNRLVFVFDKEQTKDVFKKWRNYELQVFSHFTDMTNLYKRLYIFVMLGHDKFV